jgi:hypothetical protein
MPNTKPDSVPDRLCLVELRCPRTHCRERGCGLERELLLNRVKRRRGDPLIITAVCPRAKDKEITFDFSTLDR